MEWYDFFLYGNAAALIFGRVFFPKSMDPLLATLVAFAGFAIGFLARPVGAVIFGHIGDRAGRRSALMWTLFLMGGATFMIGMLPSYEQVGILAPALLLTLRIVQGIAAGGEWSGGVLLISENASDTNRGFLSAWSQVGVGLGLVLASATFYASNLLSPAHFAEWGWRIPFLLSLVIFGVGVSIRARLPDSPAFERVAAQHAERSMPVLEALRRYPRQILIAVGLRLAENGGIYIFTAFAITYGRFIGVDGDILVLGVTLGTAIDTGAMLAYGALSDRVGRAPVYLFGAVAMVVLAYPFFWLIQSGSTPLVILAFVLVIPICHAAMIGVQPSLLTEMFPTDIRYSCVALGHEIGSVVAGGIAPVIATALLARTRVIWPVVVYLIIIGVITAIAVLFREPGVTSPLGLEGPTALGGRIPRGNRLHE
jgi:MFS family permease